MTLLLNRSPGAPPTNLGTPCPGLLVSVRSPEEAEAAIAGGADWIDVKEPAHGALGPAASDTIAAVVEVVAGRRPVSVALGELNDLPKPLMIDGQLLAGVRLAKVGLAGCGQGAAWPSRLTELAAQLPPPTELVAVHYADWRESLAPPAEPLLALGLGLGLPVLLVDTFFKDGRTLLDHYSTSELKNLFEAALRQGMQCVAAGSLRLGHLPAIRTAQPHLIAVRGAACDGAGRRGEVSVARVAQLKSRLGKSPQRFS